ncbi:MAG: elongation factor G [Kiritimatiellaeota bacterium]|nr:elongation factor G [Kiritimatiellota bacterium]
MKITVEKSRNFVVAGHAGSGKTSLCDLMLYKSGGVERCGKVDQKNSVSDYTEDEQQKLSSIYASTMHCDWNDNHFFFVDTPGYGEFICETIAALNAVDSALIVVDAVNGVEVGTARAWKLAKNKQLPRLILVNRLDKERADFAAVLNQIQDAYGKTICVPFTMPVGKEGGLTGVVNVLKDDDIPADIADEVAAYKEQLMDTIAESDEELMMRYLDGEQLSDDEIATGLPKAIESGDLVPVFAGSVEKDIGVTELMNAVAQLLPNPLAKGEYELEDGEKMEMKADGPGVAFVYKSIVDPFIGQLTFLRVVSGTFKSDSEVFNISTGSKERFGPLYLMNGKNQESVDEIGPGALFGMPKLKHSGVNNTISAQNKVKPVVQIKFPNPVMSYAITAVKSGEEDKIGSGLNKLAESDPGIKVSRDQETHELILSGMGDQHLSQTLKKLKETAKVEVNYASPKIPYRETITMSGEGQYRHKKQSGGHGQFAEVFLRVAPNPEGFEFVNQVVGGNIPKNFIPAVEKGVVEAMAVGPLAGCTVQNMTVTVYDGKHHPVDSSEMAFKIAARTAFKNAMGSAKPILLEPIQTVKIMIPDEYMGDITGDLNHKRGRILGMDAEEGMQVVNAEVPLSEMSRYATELRSMTQGRGLFEMEFAKYEMVPANVAKEIIDAYNKAQEEE